MKRTGSTRPGQRLLAARVSDAAPGLTILEPKESFMASLQETAASSKDNDQSCQKAPSGNPAAVPAEVVDQGKIRLGGAFRLPANKAS